VSRQPEGEWCYQPSRTAQQGGQTPHRRRRRLPPPPALLRLAGAVLVEAHDEWQTSDRRYLAEDSMALLTAPANEDTVASAELLTA